MKDILAQGLSDMGIAPPPGAIDTLCQYAQLLLEQNQVMNLTAITDPQQVARLHFLDSAAILAWGAAHGTGQKTSSTWLAGKSLVDVGTGAGFPGVVLKILEPSLSLTLVDSLGKRILWLEKSPDHCWESQDNSRRSLIARPPLPPAAPFPRHCPQIPALPYPAAWWFCRSPAALSKGWKQNGFLHINKASPRPPLRLPHGKF